MEKLDMYQICICDDVSRYPEQVLDYPSSPKDEVPDDLSQSIFDAFNDLRLPSENSKEKVNATSNVIWQGADNESISVSASEYSSEDEFEDKAVTKTLFL